ncbi:hypothetical protein F971_03208, partial [Acinetobacter vivianii]
TQMKTINNAVEFEIKEVNIEPQSLAVHRS